MNYIILLMTLALVLPASKAACGDGIINVGEGCDDNNTASGDGCSANCTVEKFHACVGQPSVCYNMLQRKVTDIDGAMEFFCVVLDHLDLVCWGKQEFGQLGREISVEYAPSMQPGFGTNLTYVTDERTQIVDLFCAVYYCCVILADASHTVKCWGLLPGAATSIGTRPGEMGRHLAAVPMPSGAGLPIRGCAGESMCVLFDSGRVYCNSSLSLDFVGLGTGLAAIDISCSASHTCALLNNSQVKCWGSNDYGELGIENMTTVFGDPTGDNLTPVQIFEPIAAVVTGTHSTCVVTQRGGGRCFGLNASGWLGGTCNTSAECEAANSTRYGSVSTLGDIQFGDSTLGNVSNISCTKVNADYTSSYQCCFLFTSGRVRCLGGNSDGQLGVPTSVISDTTIGMDPVDLVDFVLPSGTRAVRIFAHDLHTAAVLDDGRLVWYGKLGAYESSPPPLPTDEYRLCPLAFHVATDVSAFCGYSMPDVGTYACMVVNGLLKCYGNFADNLFAGSVLDDSPPTLPIPDDKRVVQLACGEQHILVLLDDGTAYAYGMSKYGQTASGTTVPVNPFAVPPPQPVQFPVANATVVGVAAGFTHSVFVLANGSVYGAGTNAEYELGYGAVSVFGTTPEDLQSWPAMNVTDLGAVAQACAGDAYTCLRSVSGQVKCFGSINSIGQPVLDGDPPVEPMIIDFGNGVPPVQEISCGPSTACAIFSDGGVKCFGSNSYGQAGYDWSVGNAIKLFGTPNVTAMLYVDLGTDPDTGAPYTAARVAIGRLGTCMLLNEIPRLQCYGLYEQAYVDLLPYAGWDEVLDVSAGSYLFLARTAAGLINFSMAYSAPGILPGWVAWNEFTYIPNNVSQTPLAQRPNQTAALTVCRDGYSSTQCRCSFRGTYVDQRASAGPLLCPAGHYSPRVGLSECLECPLGTYMPDTGAVECRNCSAGTIASTAGSIACTPCPHGFHQPLEGQTACVPCPPHQKADYEGTVECQACLQGYRAAGGDSSGFASTHCEPCPPCPAGTYMTPGGECPTCVACPQNTVSSVINSAVCIACAQGSYTVDSITCLPCPACNPGYYLVPGGSCGTCVECDVNTFSSSSNAESCTTCPSGQFTSRKGSIYCCDVCPPGTRMIEQSFGCPVCEECPETAYSTTENAAACIPCGQGYYAINNHTGCAMCPICPAGAYLEPGVPCGSCVVCPQGTFSNVSNAANCTACPPQTYTNSSQPTQCCEICRPGFFRQTVVGSECPVCVQCPVNTYTEEHNSGTCLSCPKDQFALPGESECHKCLTGTQCREGQNPLSLLDGYYRASTNDDIYECRKTEGCVGGQNTTRCAKGYSHVLCDVCDDGYFDAFDRCAACPAEESVSVALLVIAIIVVVTVVGLLAVRSSSPVAGRSIKLKILLNYVQVLAFVGGFAVRWSSEMKAFFGIADSAGNAGSAQLLSAKCALHGVHYYSVFVFYMVLPFVAASVTLVSFTVVWIVWRLAKRATAPVLRNWFVQRAFPAMVFVVFFLYMKVSATALEIFHCTEIDGAEYLWADMSVRCDTKEHAAYRALSIVMLIVFTAGLPIGIAIALALQRQSIAKGTQGGKMGLLAACRFLYDGYRSTHFYWEVVVLARKLAVAIIVVFLSTSAFYQTFAGIWIIQAALVAHIICRPFSERIHHWLEAAALVVLWITMVAGLLYWRSDLDNTVGLSAALIFVNVATTLAIIGVGIATDAKMKTLLAYIKKRRRGTSEGRQALEAEMESL